MQMASFKNSHSDVKKSIGNSVTTPHDVKCILDLPGWSLPKVYSLCRALETNRIL